jgi:hypothetical protein
MEDLGATIDQSKTKWQSIKIIVTDGVFYGWCCCTLIKKFGDG